MKTKHLSQYPLWVFLFTLSMLMMLAPPYLFSYLMDDIILAGDYGRIVPWAILALLTAAIANLMHFYFVTYATTKKSITNAQTLGDICIGKLLRMPLTVFEKKEKSYYLNVFLNSVSIYGDMHAQLYLERVACIICVCLILGIAFSRGVLFGLLFALMIPLTLLNSWVYGKKLADMQKVAVIKQDAYLDTLKDAINHKREIGVLKEQDFFEKRFIGHHAGWVRFVLKYKFNVLLMQALPNIIVNTYHVLFLLVGALLIQRSALSPGELIMYYQYLGFLGEPVSRIAEIAVRNKANKEHIQRVDDLSHCVTENDAHKAREVLEDALADMESFTLYADQAHCRRLFHAGTLRLSDRGLYLLKGQNGTGKSMLLNFLLGYVGLEFGDGEAVFAKGIVDKTAFLTYPLFFIPGTARENLFSQEVNQPLVDRLRINFLSKEISTSPLNLSLGEQQKIALLRVLSSPSRFLFLDEPFSNLDGETKESIASYLGELRGQKAMVVVMHGDELDEIADGIFTIQDGELVTSTPGASCAWL